MTMEADAVRLNMYGLRVLIRCTEREVVREVARDFSSFRVSPGGRIDLTLEVEVRPPPWELLPALRAAQYTPRNITYRDGSVTWLDYFGRALARVEREAGRMTIWGTDIDLLREIVFLTLLSWSGEYLDRRGLHRIHALGISYRGRAVLIMMPSGGGKSTLALQMLKQPGVTLLGEDSPLVDAKGQVYPFQLRPGIKDPSAAGIPPEYLRTVRRMEFDPKTLVDLDYFAGRLSPTVPAGILLLGQRSSGTRAAIEPLGTRQALEGLIKNMVVGLGLYQGVEFVLEHSGWELVGKSGVAAARMRAAIGLLRTCRTGVLVLGREIPHNAEVLMAYLQRELG